MVPVVTPVPVNTMPATTGSPPVTASNVKVMPLIVALYNDATPPIIVVVAPVKFAVPLAEIAPVKVAGVSRAGLVNCIPGLIFSYNVAVISILDTETGLLRVHVFAEPLTI